MTEEENDGFNAWVSDVSQKYAPMLPLPYDVTFVFSYALNAAPKNPFDMGLR